MTRTESKQPMLYDLGAVPVVADALDPDQVAEAVARAKPDVIVHQLTAIGAGETGVAMMTDVRGASNAKAKRELSWRPAHRTWHEGFAAAAGRPTRAPSAEPGRRAEVTA